MRLRITRITGKGSAGILFSLVLFLGMLPAVVSGQTAASYTYSRDSGAIYNGIESLPGVSTISVGGMISDDGTSSGIPIGFGFVFCGVAYTSLAANANGIISLAGSIGSVPYTNTAANIGSAGWLMPFWDDLTGTGKNVYYLTSGIAPNRMFTMQWGDPAVQWPAYTSVADTATFQVKLYEGSNIVQFCYGGHGYTGLSGSIGIANSSTDYRVVASSSATTASSIAFASGIPTSISGTVMTWSPIPCTGTPIPGGVMSSVPSACPATTVFLSDTGSTLAPVTRQWQSSPDGATWTDISGGASLNYSFVGLTMPTYFRCVVTCAASGLSASTAPLLVGTSPCDIIADSIASTPDTVCTGAHYFVRVNGSSPLLALKTYYGDGTSDLISLVTSGAISYAVAAHNYAAAGSYTVKQVLYYDGLPQDSISFHYEYVYCKMLPVKLYLDINGDCSKESAEPYNCLPLLVKIDSAGVPVDTMSATSGIYYRANGPVGTVYSFSVISAAEYASCPVSGVLYDTIVSTVDNYPVKQFGLSCSGTSDIDLSAAAIVQGTGPWRQWGHIYLANAFCPPANGTVTMHFSPRYMNSSSTSPVPSTVAGNTMTWNLSGLTSMTPGPVDLYFYLNHSGPLLTAGDTVHEDFAIACTSGTDVNLSNNMVIKEDTVRASCDPNFVEVSPASCFSSDTQLTYTIHFENTGNDTAHNIYVMDTLSANIDLASLRIVMASSTMNITLISDGIYNVAKFDFPNINLLDSSHHGLCDGAAIFKVNTKPGLPDGTEIYNHAGIYFDINPVVMTNAVVNTKGCPSTLNTDLPEMASVQVYPNPASDELVIKMLPAAYNSFSITNSIGQHMLQQPLELTATKVDIKALSPGVYYITFKGDNGTSVQKIVKL